MERMGSQEVSRAAWRGGPVSDVNVGTLRAEVVLIHVPPVPGAGDK